MRVNCCVQSCYFAFLLLLVAVIDGDDFGLGLWLRRLLHTDPERRGKLRSHARVNPRAVSAAVGRRKPRGSSGRGELPRRLSLHDFFAAGVACA